jgi:hypothetical protein
VIHGSTLLDAAGVNGKDGIYVYKDSLYLDKKFYNAGVELTQADICRDFHTKSLLRLTE